MLYKVLFNVGIPHIDYLYVTSWMFWISFLGKLSYLKETKINIKLLDAHNLKGPKCHFLFFFFFEGWLCCGAISDATDSLPSYKDAMNTNRLHSVCCIKITYGEKNVVFHLKVTKTPLKRWRHRNMVLSCCPASEAKEEEEAEKFWTRWYFSRCLGLLGASERWAAGNKMLISTGVFLNSRFGRKAERQLASLCPDSADGNLEMLVSVTAVTAICMFHLRFPTMINFCLFFFFSPTAYFTFFQLLL